MPPEIHTTINLGLDLRISQDYIAEENQRLRAYKRIAEASTPERARDVLEEMEDRYGRAPDSVRLLTRFSLAKSFAERLGVETIDRRQGFFNLKFHGQAKVDPSRLMDIVRTTPSAQFTPEGVLRLPLAAAGASSALIERLEEYLEKLAAEPVPELGAG